MVNSRCPLLSVSGADVPPQRRVRLAVYDHEVEHPVEVEVGERRPARPVVPDDAGGLRALDERPVGLPDQQDGEEEAAVRLGGSRDELGRNVALTGYGQVLWCGLTLSSDFPTTTNAVQRNLLGLSDAFLVSYDAETLNPNKNAYSTLLGSTGEDACNALSGTTPGLALLVGESSAEDFPVTLEGVGIGGSEDGFYTLMLVIPPNSPTPVPTATILPVTKTPIVLLTPTIPLDYTPLAASATPLLSATLPPTQGGTPVFLPQIESGGKPKSTGAAVPSKHTPTPEQPILPSETPAEVEPTPVKEKNNTWLIAGVVMLVLAGGVLGFWLRKSRHAK